MREEDDKVNKWKLKKCSQDVVDVKVETYQQSAQTNRTAESSNNNNNNNNNNNK